MQDELLLRSGQFYGLLQDEHPRLLVDFNMRVWHVYQLLEHSGVDQEGPSFSAYKPNFDGAGRGGYLEDDRVSTLCLPLLHREARKSKLPLFLGCLHAFSQPLFPSHAHSFRMSNLDSGRVEVHRHRVSLMQNILFEPKVRFDFRSKITTNNLKQFFYPLQNLCVWCNKGK